nr:hypothetical protein GCM10020093_095360 [Planobispora longispora]
MIFRARNLVVTVQYSRKSPEDSGGATREGALTTTRWILGTLSRTK